LSIGFFIIWSKKEQSFLKLLFENAFLRQNSS